MVSPGELGVNHTTDGSRSTWMGGLKLGSASTTTGGTWTRSGKRCEDPAPSIGGPSKAPGTAAPRPVWAHPAGGDAGRGLPAVRGVVVGRDTLSEGWGVRSLFRGRHAAPAPFIQFAVDGGGRLRYRHRVEALQGAPHIDCWTGAVGDPRTWVPTVGRLRTGIERMLVSHRVEVDFGTRLTGALWGGVVWNVEDGRRAFEPITSSP